MASTLSLPIPIWALLPLLTADSVPLPCALPFIFNKTRYLTCITDGGKNGKPWCATTPDYDKDSQKKICNDSEYGGEPGGQPCVFPFVYKKQTFYTCTNQDAHIGRFWCATTGNYDKDGQWSYCADTRLHADRIGPCVFPFIYKEKSYSSCTTKAEDSGKLWCSLTKNFGSKWTYCDPSEIRPCYFPFIFNGKTYSSCTREGAPDGQLWCATTANYDMNSKWKQCSLEDYEGNSKGRACVFPFIYKNRTFYTCTNEENKNGLFWCATTGNYDKDKKWSYCADTRLDKYPKGPCVFPFIYNGKSYSSCTTDGSRYGTLWCSLSRNHDLNPKSAECNPSEPFPCIFPFIFKGKSYSACTAEGSADGQLWCSTTGDYDKDGKWKACSVKEHGGNSYGQACIFPFRYNRRMFYTCINKDKDNEKFWCATTEDYDRDEMWSYCADTRLAANAHKMCMFPFLYNGHYYSSCTSHGSFSGKLWCSLTSNYDEDFRWDYCNSSALYAGKNITEPAVNMAGHGRGDYTVDNAGRSKEETAFRYI